MNYEEMSDFEINRLVAKSLGLKLNESNKDNGVGDLTTTQRYAGAIDFVQVNYCNNPSDAWPIMLDNNIGVCHYDLDDSDELYDYWFAISDDVNPDNYPAHKNPLLAAIICFLKMKELEK